MRKPFNGSFPITQGFGGNAAAYAKFGLKGHNGIDYGLPSGTPLVAAISGKVMETTNDPTGYGLYVKLESVQEGALTAHMKSFNVSVGQDVKEGDLIGFSDNTGNSTGPHLHFGYYKMPRDRSNGYNGYIDPTPYFGITSSPPTMNDRRNYWFDLMNKVVWNKPHEQITDAEVTKFVAEYPTQRNRSGLWDKLCLKAGITSDSNQVTVDQLYEKIKAQGGSNTQLKAEIQAVINKY